MIRTEYTKRYCSNYTEIENYAEVIADTTQTWACHHRLETHTSDGEKRPVQLTPAELKALDMYYGRPPEELIFLTVKDHLSLHKKGNTNCKGHKHSEETKKKISEAQKGYKRGPTSKETKKKISNSLNGHEVSEETKKKISDDLRGHKLSEETKRKKSESMSKLGWRIDPTTGKRVWYRKES